VLQASSKTTDEGDFWEVAGGSRGKVTREDSSSGNNVNGVNRSSSSATAGSGDFGGVSMTAEMRAWCTQQMQKIKGSDDITLLEFCMSLDSALEIRTYIQQYLGAKAEVVNFATEFLRRKAETPKKGGGEMTSSSSAAEEAKKKKKKGAKGQKLDAGMIGLVVHSNRPMGEIDFGDS